MDERDDQAVDQQPDRQADQTDDPRLRASMVVLVEAMVAHAGSNRRLQEAAGVSEATVRNFRRGRFPRSTTTTARQLDAWAAATLPDHPPPGADGSLSDLLARWQGRWPEVLDDGAAEAAPARRRLASPRLAWAVAALAVVAALVVGGVATARSLDDGSTASGVAGVRVDRDVPLDGDNFCSWRLGTDPIPLVSEDPLVMRVDARCNAPAEPDPVLDVGASVYDEPSNDTGERVGRIRDGNSFVPTCFAAGADEVADAVRPANTSTTWLRAEEPAGWLPVVNVGGGYTTDQLEQLGLPACG